MSNQSTPTGMQNSIQRSTSMSKLPSLSTTLRSTSAVASWHGAISNNSLITHRLVSLCPCPHTLCPAISHHLSPSDHRTMPTLHNACTHGYPPHCPLGIHMCIQLQCCRMHRHFWFIKLHIDMNCLGWLPTYDDDNHMLCFAFLLALVMWDNHW
jgi:hypothetical protein